MLHCPVYRNQPQYKSNRIEVGRKGATQCDNAQIYCALDHSGFWIKWSFDLFWRFGWCRNDHRLRLFDRSHPVPGHRIHPTGIVASGEAQFLPKLFDIGNEVSFALHGGEGVAAPWREYRCSDIGSEGAKEHQSDEGEYVVFHKSLFCNKGETHTRPLFRGCSERQIF